MTRIILNVASSRSEKRGSADLHKVSKSVAIRNGVIAFGVCWGVAILMLPIPIIHLIATPILLLMGPFIGFLIYKFQGGGANISNAEAVCPDCNAPLTLGPYADVWPLWVKCGGCEEHLRIYQLES